jgi:hypothetical protein
MLAEQDLIQILPSIEALKTEFDAALNALMSGSVSQQEFTDELQHWLLPQWDVLETNVRRSSAVPGSLHERADDDLMGVINNWQLGLRAYTEDLRNQRQVVRTFDYLQDAQRLQSRAETMRRELERRPQ